MRNKLLKFLLIYCIVANFIVIPETYATTTALPLGWGGYITTVSYANSIMDTLHSEGRTAIAYWIRPHWYYSDILGQSASTKNFNKDIADALLAKAQSYGMQLIIKPEHNWPSPDYDILDKYSNQWENDVVTIGNYYKAYPETVILEPSSEYGNADQISHYSHLAQTLRVAGIHNRLVFGIWWNIPMQTISDPDNNYGIARHLYLSNTYDHLSDPASTTLDQIKVKHTVSGVSVSLQGMMNAYFNSTSNMYLQRAKQLNIPLGFWITEAGPAVDDYYLNHPTNIGIAFDMLLNRYAIQYNVPIIDYRFGEVSWENQRPLYQTKAQDYFSDSYFPSGSAPNQAPSYGSINYNNTIVSQPTKFSVNLFDDNALSKVIFSIKNPSTWTNDSATSISGTHYLFNVTKTLTASVGATVQFRWFFNDSGNVWASTPIQSLITSSVSIPILNTPSVSTTVAGSSAGFNISASSTVGLSGAIFSTNNTGTWINQTWIDPWGGTPTSGTTSQTQVLNINIGDVVSYQWYVNDTSDNWSNQQGSFIVTEAPYAGPSLPDPETPMTRVLEGGPTLTILWYTLFPVLVLIGIGLYFVPPTHREVVDPGFVVEMGVGFFVVAIIITLALQTLAAS